MSLSLTSRVIRSAREVMESYAPLLARTPMRTASANLALAGATALAKAPPSEDTSHTNMWITVFPVSAPSPESNGSPPSDPLFILSLLSPWPGVLGSSVEPHELDRAILLDAISTLVNAAIGAGVTPQRLTSIIGPKVLVDPFMDAWDTAASVKRSPKPVLHMYLAHVERATLRPPTRASPADVTLGQCTLEDLDVVAVMCERFAATTPHPLDTRVAFAHAKMILEAKQLYGARINGQLRCIVCVTRPTPGNMAISKVWTEPEARGKGLAEALVRYAVERTFDGGCPSVCLFVEPSNPKAVGVYGRVGFSGLMSGVPREGSEEWMECKWETVQPL